MKLKPFGEAPRLTYTGKILVAIMSDGVVRLDWAVALATSTWPAGRPRHFMNITGHSIEHGRNTALKTAIDEGYESLFFWDHDVIPPQKTPLVLLDALDQLPDVAVVSAIYPMRGHSPHPIVQQEKGKWWWGWQDKQAHYVYMAGTGMTALRVSAFADLDVPTYKDDVGLEYPRFFGPKERFTDDFNLADLCQENGLKWLVVGDCVCYQAEVTGRLGATFRVDGAKIVVS